MANKRPDRRIGRTRRALKEALTALVLEKGYDSLTVEELTQRADLSRTTFYLHYRDKEQLLLESVDVMVNDLIRQITQLPVTAWGRENLAMGISPGNPLKLIFDHAAENAGLYRLVLRVEGAFTAQERLRNTISSSAAGVLQVLSEQESPELKPQVPVEIFSHYFAAALLGTVTWWLEADMPYEPAQMAEYFQKMFFSGAYQALGV
jgi:AcrR family transcriptional regulator